MTIPFLCLCGNEHIWVPTAAVRKIDWSSNTYAEITDDAPEEREYECAVCGETRWREAGRRDND